MAFIIENIFTYLFLLLAGICLCGCGIAYCAVKSPKAAWLSQKPGGPNLERNPANLVGEGHPPGHSGQSAAGQAAGPEQQ